ncbi:MAG: hypothetical protein WB471_13180, partial [Nocardioides sp.]
ASPSTTRPSDTIRVSCIITNLGTVAPASMNVTVRLTPLVGGIEDIDPTTNNTEYTFVSRTVGADQVVTLVFKKSDPQIGPDTTSFLMFSFESIAEATSTLRKGTISVLPSVPAPGTASPGFNDYE